MGGNVNGLAAMVTPGFDGLGFAGGMGGNVNGLAAMETPGFDGLGFAGGMGGNVNGLAAKVTCGLAGGMGGNVSGLAITETATAAIVATKTTPRILDIRVMILHSLREGTTTHTNSNPNGAFVHPKSVIADSFF